MTSTTCDIRSPEPGRPPRLGLVPSQHYGPCGPLAAVRLVETYKLHRTLPGSPAVVAEERLRHQVPVLWSVLARCGIPVVGHPGAEAEDIIGTLAARAPGDVAIFSGDRDLFQLVRDPDVWVLYPRRGTSDLIVVNEAYIADKYEIPGRAYLDYA